MHRCFLGDFQGCQVHHLYRIYPVDIMVVCILPIRVFVCLPFMNEFCVLCWFSRYYGLIHRISMLQLAGDS
uniref:Uncharacterized protein n=1 Tax=Tetranychus urticae TaxID=32264 RepID=T1KF91_TETUR